MNQDALSKWFASNHLDVNSGKVVVSHTLYSTKFGTYIHNELNLTDIMY